MPDGRANGHCMVEDSRGKTYTSEKVILCNGSDFQHLFPDLTDNLIGIHNENSAGAFEDFWSYGFFLLWFAF